MKDTVGKIAHQLAVTSFADDQDACLNLLSSMVRILAEADPVRFASDDLGRAQSYFGLIDQVAQGLHFHLASCRGNSDKLYNLRVTSQRKKEELQLHTSEVAELEKEVTLLNAISEHARLRALLEQELSNDKEPYYQVLRDAVNRLSNDKEQYRNFAAQVADGLNGMRKILENSLDENDRKLREIEKEVLK